MFINILFYQRITTKESYFMADFQVNFKEMKGMEKSLNELDRSAIPVAIRQTLNDLAFEVRQVTLPEEYHKAMIAKGIQGRALVNSPLFAVAKADGFDVDSMRSEMGAEKGFGNIAQGMATQQAGANITDRGYIPVEGARSGNKKTAAVKKSAYLANIEGKLINPRRVSRRVAKGTKKSKTVAALIMAHKLNKFFVGARVRGKFGKDNIYERARPVRIDGKGDHREVSDYGNILVYAHKRKVSNKASSFLSKAGVSAAAKLGEIHRRNIEKQMRRIIRKYGL
jgi:hypothetical protein